MYASSICPTSFHYTQDGFEVEIEYGGGYGENDENFIVSTVNITPVDNDTIIYNLLNIDKP